MPINASELTAQQQVTAIYVAYYDRAPDPAGLQFWTDKLQDGQAGNPGGLSLAEVATAFSAAAETKAKYPFFDTPDVASPDAFITGIYTNLFGRTPDPEGAAFWSDALASGAVPVGEIILAILEGAQDAASGGFPDSETITNKIDVGLDWAVSAAESGIGLSNDPIAEEIDGKVVVNNPDAFNSATSILDGVDGTEQSVTDAKSATDTFISGGGGTGQAFVLTTGLDAVTGTNASDTITGTFEDGTSTITPGDSIDGGGGNADRFNVIASDETDEENFASIQVTNVEQFFFRNVDNSDLDLDMIGVDDAEQLWIDRSQDDVYLDNVNFEFTVGFNQFGYNQSADEDFDITVNDSVYAGDDDTLNVVLQSAGSINDDDYADLYLDNATGDDVIESMVIQSVSARAGDGNYFWWNDDSLTTSYTISGSADLLLELSNAGVVEDVDASGLAADMSFEDDLNNADGVTYIGATGADTVVFGDGDNTITTGTGDDVITIGSGDNTVNTGEGDDTVDVDGNDVSAISSIDLGAGDDVVTGLGVVNKDASVDGGEGNDTLQLKAVGVTNVGAFLNFEVFDVVDMTDDLDIDILETNNTVTEIIGSGALASNPVELSNLSAGVGFRATGDMGATNEIELTQETAGSLSITLDVDEAEADTVTDDNDLVADATNATSVTVTFDSDNIDTIEDGYANTQTITLDTGAATSVDVVSGGTESSNVLALNDTSADGSGNSVLTSVTVSGDQALDLSDINTVNAVALDTVDASDMTGDLTIELADLAEGATVSLGSGSDTVQLGVGAGTIQAEIEELVGFEAAASNAASDVEEADLIDYANVAAIVADDTDGAGDVDIVDGVVQFLGAGPATFADAVSLVDTAVGTDNEAALFEYIGNSYVFVENTGGDSIVEMVGTTGVTELGADANGDLFIV